MASTNRYFLITNIESLFLSPLFGLSPKAQPYTLTWIPENRALVVKAKHTDHHLDPFVIVVIYRPNISSHRRTFFSSLVRTLSTVILSFPVSRLGDFNCDLSHYCSHTPDWKGYIQVINPSSTDPGLPAVSIPFSRPSGPGRRLKNQERHLRRARNGFEIYTCSSQLNIENLLANIQLSRASTLATTSGAKWCEADAAKSISSLVDPVTGVTYTPSADLFGHTRSFYQSLYSSEPIDYSATHTLIDNFPYSTRFPAD
ncbi:hypothetical protein PHYBLDRAFT_153709 [Phycomyces blakesleeanus NRRL 1555(-)]|uniref:Endonuclease/exonuclease/phosphatase domain-containing protein n=1 Tax=Phycomyces blakesleeanus (strain ATCC 8743b / DSM 1359 / FGSC 10004 / NBRC 33097 / NRRL 1555) TaxID=763407 RepID=A0A162Z9D3_PHYB8|nr:hypothetical protein PHYBLDRAFT_153709 [Phycomyces blakesleeanus NRRL 1555(-)]OAD65191.1 hypothetical protein PHYBLDRAFT_153709 [Phycomyces blakesleeanus NRRL 1555(-)]|eukprot:XP_018283231.1 hypothetical protein PHYBLDRAFT_153709 [Phycomyces blakesleeanus NRRL 1555(-)]